MDKIIPVKVSVRVRPFNSREKDENAQECLKCFVEQNQLLVNDRFFAFDFVFDSDTAQESVYEGCAAPLLDDLFKGYNCTVFAYGQTGSGKTYTMGTEQTTHSMLHENRGIIPRIVDGIFARIRDSGTADCFVVKCSMLEIYEERVLDLLGGGADKESLTIREANKGNVFVQGLSERDVSSLRSTMSELERGCQIRSKGQTAMNSTSSRSHAVFTLTIHKTPSKDDETSFAAKLHLVDLAGSERLKKTMAQGERMKEGIKINEGLLALGNVISALTETTQTRQHIPYRDSKLTRLLQDSLGGNSYTVMIACVSPADTNCEETMSTLRYAERAKKIKNKPIVNQDPNAATIQKLRQEVQSLRHELLQYKAGEVLPSAAAVALTGGDRRELDELRERTVHLETTNMKLQTRLAEAVADRARIFSQMASLEDSRDHLNQIIDNVRRVIEEKKEQTEDESLSSEHRQWQQRVLLELEEVLPSHADVARDLEERSFDGIKKEDDTDGDDTEVDEQFPSRFVEVQSALSREMEDLLSQIREKERLIEQTAANHEIMNKMRAQHEQDMVELQSKIDNIQHERDLLAEQLRRVSNSTKVSEERRKRLQELEKELANHRKTMQELKRLEKLKSQDADSIQKMRAEILEMKQTRVQMVKQLRIESEKYRQWQIKYEREMNQMKQRERKREYEAAKAKRNFNQQLTVYRRKYEEAQSCNKRLQQQLQRQEVARNKKFTDLPDGDRLFREVKTFLEQELDLVAGTEEARIHCDDLIQQRKELSQQVARLRKRMHKLEHEPPAKRRTGSDRSGADSSDEVAKLKEQVAAFESEIELRNTEIRDLQIKCSSYDAETRMEQRWAAVHTTVHAKCALKLMFDMAANSRKELIQTEQQIEELTAKKRDLIGMVNERDEQLSEAKRKFDDDRQSLHEQHARLEREHQETVAFLIALISRLAKGGAMNTDELDKLMRLSAESESRQKLLADLADSENRNNQLSTELNKAKVNPNRQRLFRSVVSTSDLSADQQLPAARQTRSQRWSRPVQRLGMVSSNLLPDDSTNDEDLDESSQETPFKAPKRSLHGGPVTYCKCKSSCNSLCGCAKRQQSCKAACGCPEDCLNRAKEGYDPANRRGTFTVAQSSESNESEMPDENASVAMNQTFCLKTDSSLGSDSSDTKSPVHCTLLASQKRLAPTGRRPGYFKPVFDDKDSQ